MTGKPTPTPWTIFKSGIGEENGDGIASLWREGVEREANAALIVRAVNAHEGLIAALEGLIAAHLRSYDPIHKEAIAAARAALARGNVP